MDDRPDASELKRAPAGGAPSRLARLDDRPPLQRVGVLVEIPRVLCEMNVDPEPSLAGLGSHRAALSDVDGWLPFPVISDLVLSCIAATGREDFPLVLGASARIRHWGIMGTLLSAAITCSFCPCRAGVGSPLPVAPVFRQQGCCASGGAASEWAIP